MSTETTYLEYIDESRNAFKFYEVTIQDKNVIIRYGRINTKGTQKKLSFISNSEAFYQANTKIDEKVLKGYKIIERVKQEKLISRNPSNVESSAEIVGDFDKSIFSDFFLINFPTPRHAGITNIIRSALVYISPSWVDLSTSFKSQKIIEQVFFNSDFYSEFPFIHNEDIRSFTHRFEHVPSNYWLKYLCGIDIVFNTSSSSFKYFGLMIAPENKSKTSQLFNYQIQKAPKSPILLNFGIQNLFIVSLDISSGNKVSLSWDILTDIEKWEIAKKISDFVLCFCESNYRLIPTLHLTI